MGKKHGPEEIIGKLREAEIVLAQGGTTGDACRRIAVTEQTFGRRCASLTLDTTSKKPFVRTRFGVRRNLFCVGRSVSSRRSAKQK